ncbi:MAG: c-type cytochrome [Cytophagaceae bacterium]|nr:c-type cytochrome [Cytophagaceae bacterium]
MSKINILRSVSRTLVAFFIASVATFNTIAQDSTAAAASGADAALIAQGEQLFKENCKSCHHVYEESVGPALSGVTKRRKTAWLHSWIRNSSKMIADGDKEAVELFNKWNKVQMTSFPTFTDAQIDAILLYVENAPKPAAKADPSASSTTAQGQSASGSSNDTLILGIVVVVLILVLVVLTIFISVIKRFLKEKEATLAEDDKELVNQSFDIKKFVSSKGFIAIVSVIFVVITIRACWLGMMDIGVHQNYQPVQPIPYSHKLHAGDLKINCNYCHTTVYKSKSASIPSLNICMNCHTHVKKGPSGSEDLIKQLTDAYEKNQPIRWIRVHNLPDLAYFNHSQHTTVAGIECQKCHGPIEEMEVVKQYSNLTMGWCINCHRETAVNAKDNAYYDRLLKVHEQAKRKGDMTAENIGGLDCSKCHY